MKDGLEGNQGKGKVGAGWLQRNQPGPFGSRWTLKQGYDECRIKILRIVLSYYEHFSVLNKGLVWSQFKVWVKVQGSIYFSQTYLPVLKYTKKQEIQVAARILSDVVASSPSAWNVLWGSLWGLR